MLLSEALEISEVTRKLDGYKGASAVSKNRYHKFCIALSIHSGRYRIEVTKGEHTDYFLISHESLIENHKEIVERVDWEPE